MSDLELREKVATLVMGWRKQRVGVLHEGVMFQRAASYPTPLDMLPAYESDIAAAWLVVERMRGLGWLFNIGTPGEIKAWSAEFDMEREHWHEDGTTAPEAICRAALAAMEATQ